MARIIFNIPSEKFNQLNNFYLENFGYDIHTQIQNFLFDEMKKCEDYSAEPSKPHPIPVIRESRSKYLLIVSYPDGSTSSVYHEDYGLLLKIWNEWSKYGFEKESKDEVLSKFLPSRVPHEAYRLRHKVNGKTESWGTYASVEEQREVRNFLEKCNWDKKYHYTNLNKNVSGCNKGNYSQYLLQIARGEMEL